MPRDYRRSRPPGSAQEIIFGAVDVIERKHAWQASASSKGQPYMFCTREFCSRKWWPDQNEVSRGECRGK